MQTAETPLLPRPAMRPDKSAVAIFAFCLLFAAALLLVLQVFALDHAIAAHTRRIDSLCVRLEQLESGATAAVFRTL